MLERHHTITELSKAWALSYDTVQSMFEYEPGVMIIDRPETKHKRGYRTMRVPEHVVARVYARVTNRRAS